MKHQSHAMAWAFSAVVGLIAVVYLLMGFAGEKPSDKEFHFADFGRLPIVDHGRVKPIDTLARVNLMILSGRQEYRDAKNVTQPATRWMLDVMTAPIRQKPTDTEPIPGESKQIKAYRVDNPSVREMLGLKSSEENLSFEELFQAAGSKGLQELFQQAATINPDSSELTDRERAIAELASQIRGHVQFSLFETPDRVFRIDNNQVLSLLGLEEREGFRYSFGEFLPRLGALEREARRAIKIPQKSQSVYDAKAIELFRKVELYVGMARGSSDTLHLVAPASKGQDWKTLPEAREALDSVDRKDTKALEPHTTSIAFEALLYSYARNEPEQFNKVVDRYGEIIEKNLPTDAKTAGAEASFNAFAPFYRCSVLYVMVFLSACVYWLWPDHVLNRFAFWLMILTLLVHTWALGMRMWIQGRPPVTNLYSSAVFIGWACVVFSVFLEWKFRNGLATAVAGLTGFATLLIAHYLGGSGDTLEMMQAVLDTNFWLATHVTTVTIGYSATFIAGVFGIVYIWQMLVTAVLNSLQKGGSLSLVGSVSYFVASYAVAFLGTLVIAGVLYGIWYLGQRSPVFSSMMPQSAIRAILALLLAVGGLGLGTYLSVIRMDRFRQAAVTDLPDRIHFLERFAFTDDSRKVLTWMIYGTICFAMLFSFVGTVLGGIWADQSWGRFWGWDPKENGALLIVIMNALILHARWGGMIKDRGMATLAILGNMVTMWSWFGTNQLGIGLHAYGFNNALVLLCRWFWVSQLILIGLALLPLTAWKNYTSLRPLPVSPTPDRPTPRGKTRRGPAGVQPA